MKVHGKSVWVCVRCCTGRKEWRLLLNEHGGGSGVIEEAPNYGEEWSGNYELKRFGGAKKEERWKGVLILGGRQNNQ
jgi:hypothetical protein